MPLFTQTSFEELQLYKLHTIHVEKEYYYVGTYQGNYKFKYPTQWTASFQNVHQVFYDNSDRVVVKYLKYYNEDCVFKRTVEPHEERYAYRVAFEKRAVNQIVASIIGHAGDYY